MGGGGKLRKGVDLNSGVLGKKILQKGHEGVRTGWVVTRPGSTHFNLT